ncbi:MAG TPA: response regulator transcription factor [Candidatus Limnocylindrales bacterium]|nr:response regulator transcription factor [Candidatus Limnocylindrales bacterium]
MTEIQQQTIRTLLVDDHALFRDSVALALRDDPVIEIEHCGSIREALQRIAQKQFDVVLLDHDLGGERASQFLPAAREHGFDGRVLIVTAWVGDNEARRLMRQGAAGIFLKQATLTELIKSIRLVAAGGALEPDDHTPEAEAQHANAPVLNDRQRQVLRFVMEGLSNKEIAWKLQISESYVKAILQGLFQKTGVRTRGQLVRVAFEQYEDKV